MKFVGLTRFIELIEFVGFTGFIGNAGFWEAAYLYFVSGFAVNRLSGRC